MKDLVEDPDFLPGKKKHMDSVTLKKTSAKKRKQESDGKNEVKKTKSDVTLVKSPNGSTMDDFFKVSVKPVKKVRTLDEMFASCVRKAETSKDATDNTLKSIDTPQKIKHPSVLDLTSPEPAGKQISKADKSIKNRESEEKSIAKSPSLDVTNTGGTLVHTSEKLTKNSKTQDKKKKQKSKSAVQSLGPALSNLKETKFDKKVMKCVEDGVMEDDGKQGEESANDNDSTPGSSKKIKPSKEPVKGTKRCNSRQSEKKRSMNLSNHETTNPNLSKKSQANQKNAPMIENIQKDAKTGKKVSKRRKKRLDGAVVVGEMKLVSEKVDSSLQSIGTPPKSKHPPVLDLTTPEPAGKKIFKSTKNGESAGKCITNVSSLDVASPEITPDCTSGKLAKKSKTRGKKKILKIRIAVKSPTALKRKESKSDETMRSEEGATRKDKKRGEESLNSKGSTHGSNKKLKTSTELGKCEKKRTSGKTDKICSIDPSKHEATTPNPSRKSRSNHKNAPIFENFQKEVKTPKKNLKRRKSSSDGVLFVREVKQANKPVASPMKTNFVESQKQKSSESSELSGETLLWTEKYEPKSSRDVVGNSASTEKLVAWLKEWKKRWEKEQEEILKQDNPKNAKNSADDSDSDFELDHEDKKALKEDEDSFAKVAIIIGPTGCGKTSTVYACAKELQFKVLEMNASSQRSGKQILSRLHEATQSHQVAKVNKAFNFFVVKESTKKIEGNSLILLEDVDILFEEDKFFWSAIETLINDTKRPIILTTSDSSVLVNLERKYEKFLFGPPSLDEQLTCLKNIAQNEGCEITDGNICDVRMTNRLLSCDLRKTIHALHFWGARNDITKNETVQSKERKKSSRKSGRKRRRSNRIKSRSDDATKSNLEIPVPKSYPIQDIFSKTCGIFDIISNPEVKVQHENGGEIPLNSGASKIVSLLKDPHLKKGENITVAEQAVSIMAAANFPQFIKINCFDLLLDFKVFQSFSAGKMPLPIHVPCSTPPDSDMEFTYEFPSDEVAAPLLQEPASDFLIDEDSVDVCYDTKSVSIPSNDSKIPDERVRTSVANSTKNKVDLHTLDELSSMADMCCMSDRMEYMFSKVQRSQRIQSLDGSRCKMKDGLLDFLPITQNELSHQELATAWDVQSALQVRSMVRCFSQIEEISRETTTVPEEIPLRFPHEGKTRKNKMYLRHSMQMQFLGGSATTSRWFTVDYLPTIRSICRSENVRKEAKKKRRFLHYFDLIRVFPKPSEMSRLLNEFKEIVDSI